MSETMLAAVYHGANDLRIQTDYPIPTISAGEALLRVVNTSICGTDLRILHGGHRKYPEGTVRIPGHEVVGDLVALGSNVRGLAVGQRVFVAPNMGCGSCRQCTSGNNNLCANYEAFGITMDGAFAEYLRIPAAAILQGNVMPLDAGVDPAAAALIEPFACVLRGQNAVNVHVGDAVVVIGAGPIGMMQIMLARLRGAAVVIACDMNVERRDQASAFGADQSVSPDELSDLLKQATHGEGADVVMVAAGSPQAQEAAIQLAAIGGRINFFGGLPKDRPTITLDANSVHYKELVITGTTACSTNDCRQAAAIVNAGRINLSRLITARYPLEQAVEAFAVAKDGKSLKVGLIP